MIIGTMTPPQLEEIRAVVRAVCEGRGVARVDLFGSVARGESGIGSDVDLLVEFLPGSNIGLFEMGALKEDLEERLGCQVDLLSRRAVEHSRNPIRRAAILAQPIPVYVR
jgi:predicted nucleotidyltransferase